MKIAKSVITLMCDDVRNEVGGKLSLMGIYSKDIVVKQTPTILPLLHFVMMLEGVRQSFDKELFISLYMPAEPKAITFNYPAPPAIKIGSDFNLIIGMAPFKISSAGECKFELAIKKDAPPVISYSFSIRIKES